MKMDFETQDGFLVMNDLPHDCITNKQTGILKMKIKSK